MVRYATREEEIDRMLRTRLFVDLYHTVRHGLPASLESYSMKRLEPFYGFTRDTPLPEANSALAVLQANLELGDAPAVSAETKGRRLQRGRLPIHSEFTQLARNAPDQAGRGCYRCASPATWR